MHNIRSGCRQQGTAHRVSAAPHLGPAGQGPTELMAVHCPQRQTYTEQR